ncbi:NAD(P)-binding protein [Thermobifida halotolerans]|uniref:NAD(P)-binding protein n=1 Tax=Thermobifida halotolerans TaxID=483545 RepID=A0A399FXJ6_9ACTN|nr:NAD(P)-binding protein [Thermobifida halotolerans]UOE21247.1 NAD(P)-binding protein [Thermobifida halotolerans]
MSDGIADGPLFQPIRVGGMDLRNRIMLPPHGRLTGDLFGSERQARAQIAYWRQRAESGAAWICGLNGFVANPVIPGFEPTGLGATVRGVFRLPQFRERAARYAEAVQAAGAYASAQLIMQGGMPHSPSGLMANHTNNQVPHVLDAAEIAWFVEEYAFCAAEAKAAGLDGVELHANHEDLLQLFLSPATNRRDDSYGGDRERRTRLLLDVLRAIRRKVGADFTVGVRLNMDELFEGGYDLAEGLAIATALQASGTVDYLHCVVGNNWGAPSYIQTHHYGVARWSDLAHRFTRALDIPVVHTGRIATAAAAARVVEEGHADVVGMARAVFADGDLVAKARGGRAADIRPCVGTNDCLHRVVVEGMRFGCSVNPRTGREAEPPPSRTERPRRVLVAGAGPAGLELSALLAERGHRVSVWEREERVGGQMRVAARAAENASYADFLAFQERRLASLGVEVALGREATAEAVADAGFDVVAVATGARSRRPDIPGVDLPFVVDGREVLLGWAEVGGRVLVVAMEDHMQPLTIAGHLADLGRDVTVLYPTPAVAPLVGRYSIGAPLAKLSAAGARIEVTERVTRVEPGRVVSRNVYSGVAREHTGYDSVVLACGGEAESALYTELEGRVAERHVLGDAYAPRRISFATRQAYELALRI